MKNTVRVNFDFPKKEYTYLKMLCAEKGVTIKDFATELLCAEIEDYEDKRLAKKARKRLKTMDPKDNIPFEKAAKEAGWKKNG